MRALVAEEKVVHRGAVCIVPGRVETVASAAGIQVEPGAAHGRHERAGGGPARDRMAVEVAIVVLTGRPAVAGGGDDRDVAARGHITIVASSGDSGASGQDNNGNFYRHPVASWPATSPFVTAVGGTRLNLNASGARNGLDTAWNDTYSTAVNNFFFGNEGPHRLATGGREAGHYA